jgi:hypothetical protein
MHGLISCMDFLSSEPNLYINGTNRLKTWIGGTLSFINFILITSLSGYFLFRMLSRKDFSLVSGTQVTNEALYNLSYYPILFTPLDRNLKPVTDPKIVNYNFAFFEVNKTKGENNIIIKNASYCNIEQYPKETREFYKDYYYMNYAFCLDMNDPDLKNKQIHGSDQTNDSFNTFIFFVNKCVNGSSIICESDEVINEKIGTFYININYMDYNLDHSIRDNPGVPFKNSYMAFVSTTLFKSLNFFIYKIKYFSDYGWVFEEKLENNYFYYERPTELVDNKSYDLLPGNIGALSFQNGHTFTNFNRKYQKIQDVLANIGGIIKGIVFLSFHINKFFVNKKLIYFLSQAILESEESKDVNISTQSLYTYHKSAQVLTAKVKTNQLSM